MDETRNKLKQFVLEFQNGTQIICAKRTGFSTLLEGILKLRAKPGIMPMVRLCSLC